VVEHAGDHPSVLRTLGYLHLRERRYADAEAAFARASKAGEEAGPRYALDLARAALVRGDLEPAIARARGGLAGPGLWVRTRDELRDVLEHALISAGQRNAALDVLEERAAEHHFSFDLHHRLARERLARNDVGGAGAALERAARMGYILGGQASIDDRVPASFRSDHRRAPRRRPARRCRCAGGAGCADPRCQLMVARAGSVRIFSVGSIAERPGTDGRARSTCADAST
jgi:hypothetical protein